MAKFGGKTKILTFGNQRCPIWVFFPRICLIAKFGAKVKILKFGAKNA